MYGHSPLRLGTLHRTNRWRGNSNIGPRWAKTRTQSYGTGRRRPCEEIGFRALVAAARDRPFPEWWQLLNVPRCMSRLFCKERTAPDPEFCQGFEILLVTTGNCVFLPAFNTETALSRRVRLDLDYKRGIHERRSMDPNESVRLQL